MAKLTRMQKYSDYREQMANDSEATTVSEDLNKFQNELNKVKTYTAAPEIETILSVDSEEKTQSEISAEVIGELTEEKPDISDSDSVLKALDEIINGVSLDDDITTDIFKEIPAEVEVISADTMAGELENTANETEENYRDEINSIIDELMGITDFVVPEIVTSLSGNDQTEEIIPETLNIEITEMPAEANDVQVAEPHCVAFEIPTVKKTDKSDAAIYDQICECSDNIACVVDSEREFYGVSAPVMWVAPVKENTTDVTENDMTAEDEEIHEAEPLSIDDVISGLFDSSGEEEKPLMPVSIEEAIDAVSKIAAEEIGDVVNEEKAVDVVNETVHCIAFEIPAVKKNDKSDRQIVEQIDNCVEDFVMTIDSERIILGIPTPVLKIEMPHTGDVLTEDDNTGSDNDGPNVDEIFSIFDSIEEELNKNDTEGNEISIADIVIPEEIAANIGEANTDPLEADEIIKEEPVEVQSDPEFIPEETADAEAAKIVSADTDEIKTEIDDSIPVITVVEDAVTSDDDDITLTKEISINYISDALSEAENFSAKEGLKTVEDITTTIIREVDHGDVNLEHPVAVATAPGDTEVIEIKNFAELTDEDREAVLDDTIPFVIDKKMKKEDDAATSDDEEDFIPNRILNIVLVVLIAVLLLVLGVVIYYIFLAQGVL